ncbi:hypothetical protein A4X09_0g168 [Tilletia walkeri]|uniref:FAD-binding PCMH-type domain-containing protein n=1 Tax=Tilletia walkeri TaxID=117179 RepID=A0A8X7T7X1_9BASI|nr:hypothetical protein A4X09_0g168 [Tilletia walkeri]
MQPSLLVAFATAVFSAVTSAVPLGETLVSSSNVFETRGSSASCFCYLDVNLKPIDPKSCANPPSQADFTVLARKLSQPLLYPRPTAEPCFAGDDPRTATTASTSSAQCQFVNSQWFNGTWRADQPGSMQLPQWENLPNNTEQCNYMPTLGQVCTQANVNVLAVDARTPSDVQQAMNFARTHRLRAIVKSTGHELLGRSSFKGSLQIWTHNWKGITFNDVWRPRGGGFCKPESTVTIAPGVQWLELYTAAHAKGKMLVGGLSGQGSVGAAGGWALGGGYNGALTGKLGLGVDNILEFSVVTADGKAGVANAYQNSDLYWALRGGHAGIAIVTSLTYRVYPEQPLYSAVYVMNAQTDDAYRASLLEIIKATPTLSAEGWSDSELWNATTRDLTIAIRAVNGADFANKTLEPLFDRISAIPGVVTYYRAANSFPTFYDFYYNVFIAGPASPIQELGTYGSIGSRLISDKLYTTDPAKIVDTAIAASKLNPGIPLIVNLVAGGQVKRQSDNAMALNPGWRHAYHHIIAAGSYDQNAAPAVADAERQLVLQQVQMFDKISPSTGGYINEANTLEPRWQQTFYGANYARLLSIKKKYDRTLALISFKNPGYEYFTQCA